MEAPRVALAFNDERATQAILSFLRETKVGRTMSTPPHPQAVEEGEGDGGDEEVAEEEGPGPP